jgi:hypothetical protein
MTSEPKPRPLSLVEQNPEPVSRAETVLRQWDPEAQLVGALMHLPRARVAPILELVPDTAIWRPDNRWAYVMYSRTVFDSLTMPVVGALLRCWGALAANPCIYALRGPVIDEAPR